MKQIVLGLPPELADALDHLCGRNEAAIGDILREALRNDLKRRTRARADRAARQLAPLRAKLTDDLDDAIDWYDLQSRLRRKGYQFVRQGGGLSLRDLQDKHICNGSDLGYSHAQLTRRFGRQIPRTVSSFALAS